MFKQFLIWVWVNCFPENIVFVLNKCDLKFVGSPVGNGTTYSQIFSNPPKLCIGFDLYVFVQGNHSVWWKNCSQGWRLSKVSWLPQTLCLWLLVAAKKNCNLCVLNSHKMAGEIFKKNEEKRHSVVNLGVTKNLWSPWFFVADSHAPRKTMLPSCHTDRRRQPVPGWRLVLKKQEPKHRENPRCLSRRKASECGNLSHQLWTL